MSVVSPATRVLLALSMLKGVGPAALKKAALIPGFDEKSIEELAKSIPQIERVLSDATVWHSAQEAAAQQVEDAQRQQARILSALDAEYPPLLSATKDDPFILYVKGTLAQPPEQSVALIGTREPTAHGELIAARITQFFVEHGWSIVSGLATGCDAIAHKAALDAGGHTVAVLAHGLQMIAPAKHKKLAEDILAAGGALVSEYPFGQNVRSQQYVKRDRTQAGMAQGVVMIQSGVKGGSLYASRASLDYGRWLAVPYPTGKDRESGEPKVQANLLIADGVDAERADLLRCPLSKLQQIIVLHSREDYFQMVMPAGAVTPDLAATPLAEDNVDRERSSSDHAQAAVAVKTAQANVVDESNTSIFPSDTTAKKQIPVAAMPLDLPLPRRVVISKPVSSDLTITQMPPASSPDFKKAAARVHDVDLLVALSARLRYIQARADALVSMYGDSKDSTDEEGRLTVRFVVEDVLMQMKRAVDMIAALDGANREESDGPTTSINRDGPGVQEQFELGYVVTPALQEDSLQEILSGLVGAHPQSVGFEDEPDDTYRMSGTTDVHLGELVDALNTMIARTLHV